MQSFRSATSYRSLKEILRREIRSPGSRRSASRRKSAGKSRSHGQRSRRTASQRKSAGNSRLHGQRVCLIADKVCARYLPSGWLLDRWPQILIKSLHYEEALPKPDAARFHRGDVWSTGNSGLSCNCGSSIRTTAIGASCYVSYVEYILRCIQCTCHRLFCFQPSPVSPDYLTPSSQSCLL